MIMDSHECPEYRAGRCCARIAQVSSKKRNIAILQVLRLAIESTQYECGFEKGFSALATGFENPQ